MNGRGEKTGTVPNDAAALAAAINAAVDIIATASNLTCLQVEVVTVSGKLGMLDGECLKKRGIRARERAALWGRKAERSYGI